MYFPCSKFKKRKNKRMPVIEKTITFNSFSFLNSKCGRFLSIPKLINLTKIFFMRIKSFKPML